MKTTILAALALFCISFVASAADVSGKWAGETPGRNGAQPITITLKAAGPALTGSITTAAGETPIADGKVDGDTITFTQTVQGRDGTPNKLTYTGKVSGDSIAFTREGGRGPVTFTAKKAN
jgi:opacity protein-like surface antigen